MSWTGTVSNKEEFPHDKSGPASFQRKASCGRVSLPNLFNLFYIWSPYDLVTRCWRNLCRILPGQFPDAVLSLTCPSLNDWPGADRPETEVVGWRGWGRGMVVDFFFLGGAPPKRDSTPPPPPTSQSESSAVSDTSSFPHPHHTPDRRVHHVHSHRTVCILGLSILDVYVFREYCLHLIMYSGSAQGVVERVINVRCDHYYYCKHTCTWKAHTHTGARADTCSHTHTHTHTNTYTHTQMHASTHAHTYRQTRCETSNLVIQANNCTDKLSVQRSMISPCIAVHKENLRKSSLK